MLVTLDDMKTYLKIPLVDTTYDDFLTREINIISTAGNNYCGRILEQGSYTETWYGQDFPDTSYIPELFSFHYPVISITQIDIIERSQGVDSTTTLTADEYRLYKSKGKLKRVDADSYSQKQWFSEASINNTRIEIQYDAGYAAVPMDIQGAVFEIVAQRYQKEKSDLGMDFGSNVQRVGIPGVMNIDFDYTLTKNERENAFGIFLGDHLNVFDFYRSERSSISQSVVESIVE